MWTTFKLFLIGTFSPKYDTYMKGFFRAVKLMESRVEALDKQAEVYSDMEKHIETQRLECEREALRMDRVVANFKNLLEIKEEA